MSTLVTLLFGPEFNDAYPLHYAVKMQRMDLLREELEAGADPDARARGGITPLMVAAREGLQDYVTFLLNSGADVNLRCASSRDFPGGETALYMAAERGHFTCARILLEHGARPDILVQSGTALNIALHRNDDELAICLLEHGANPNGPKAKCYEPPLVTAASRNNLPIILALLKRGADPNRVGWSDESAIESTTDVLCATALLDKGADIKRSNRDGQTPLLRNIRRASLDLIRLYIQVGVDLNAINKNGESALMLLSDVPSIPIAELLISSGADVNACSYGRSVLDHHIRHVRDLRSMSAQREQLIQYLRSKGAVSFRESGAGKPDGDDLHAQKPAGSQNTSPRRK